MFNRPNMNRSDDYNAGYTEAERHYREMIQWAYSYIGLLELRLSNSESEAMNERAENRVQPKGAEELKPEYTKLFNGKVMCKEGFAMFSENATLIERLKTSFYRLLGVVAVEGVAILVLLVSEFLI